MSLTFIVWLDWIRSRKSDVQVKVFDQEMVRRNDMNPQFDAQTVQTKKARIHSLSCLEYIRRCKIEPNITVNDDLRFSHETGTVENFVDLFNRTYHIKILHNYKTFCWAFCYQNM